MNTGLKIELIKIIDDNDIYEYSDFIDFLFESGNNRLLYFAMSHTLFFDTYIASRKRIYELKVKK